MSKINNNDAQEIVYYYQSILRPLANATVQKLVANDAKPGWKDTSMLDLLQRAREELDELQRAIENLHLVPGVITTPNNPESKVLLEDSIAYWSKCIVWEAADVTAFLAMIVDKLNDEGVAP